MKGAGTCFNVDAINAAAVGVSNNRFSGRTHYCAQNLLLCALPTRAVRNMRACLCVVAPDGSFGVRTRGSHLGESRGANAYLPTGVARAGAAGRRREMKN